MTHSRVLLNCTENYKKKRPCRGSKAETRPEKKRKARERDKQKGHTKVNHITPDAQAPAPHKRKGGTDATEGDGSALPAAKKPRAAPRCLICRRPKSECKSPSACPDSEFAVPKVPTADYVVEEGKVIMVFDLETSTLTKGGPTTCNEAGACVVVRQNKKWLLGATDFKMVTKEPLAAWTKKTARVSTWSERRARTTSRRSSGDCASM